MTALTDILLLIFGILSVSEGMNTYSENPPPLVVREAVVLIDRQTIVFLENGREANMALVSTGRAGYDTPTGEFEVLYRRRSPVSSTYDVRMPYWLCITESGQIGLHQTFRSGTNNLGTRQSHGCVRMGFITARWSYSWLPVGSKVRIQTYGPRMVTDE